MIQPLFLIGAAILLLAIDLLAIAARASFLQTTHARLLTLREQMEREFARTAPLLQALPRLRASLNLALVFTRLGLAGLALYWTSRQPFRAPVLAAVIAVLLAGYILFLFEWQVEQKVSQNAERWAVRLAPFVRLVMNLLSWLLVIPFIFLRQAQTSAELTGMVTEDELKTLVDAGQEEGVFEQGERRMIYSIFQLADTLAREIMVPRIDMLALDVKTPLPEAVDALLQSGHSRVPVYQDTPDRTLGVLYAKDLLRVWREGSQIETMEKLLRPAYFVPEAKKVDELLSEMQSQRIHIAIVVDEYGGVAGLVTLEDIVEEILGEIRDEYDQGEEAPYQVLKNGDFTFQGRVDMDDFNEVMGSSLPKEEADTIAGYIYSQLGRVPNVGEVIEVDNLRLTVEHVSARRIRKVRAHVLPKAREENENERQHTG